MEDSILEAILADADINVKKVQNKTDKTLEQLNGDFAEEKETAIKKLAEEIEKTAKNIYAEERAKKEQNMKNALLKTKINAVKNALNDAKNEIIKMRDNEYAEYFRKKYEQIKRNETGVIYLNSRDKARIENSVFCGSEIAEKCIKTDGGFVLEYDEVDYDCRIEILFEENYSVLCDAVNKIYSEETGW